MIKALEYQQKGRNKVKTIDLQIDCCSHFIYHFIPIELYTSTDLIIFFNTQFHCFFPFNYITSIFSFFLSVSSVGEVRKESRNV